MKRNEIDWDDILTKFPNRTKNALWAKHYKLNKRKKINKVPTRFSYRINKQQTIERELMDIDTEK